MVKGLRQGNGPAQPAFADEGLATAVSSEIDLIRTRLREAAELERIRQHEEPK